MVHTDATGSFKGNVPVPKDLELGHHTLQVNAFTASGAVRSLSLGVELRAPVNVPDTSVVTVNVRFATGSYGLSMEAVKSLRALLKQAGARSVSGQVVVSAPARATATSSRALSKHRAVEVAAFLRYFGISVPIGTKVVANATSEVADDTAVITLRTNPKATG